MLLSSRYFHYFFVSCGALSFTLLLYAIGNTVRFENAPPRAPLSNYKEATARNSTRTVRVVVVTYLSDGLAAQIQFTTMLYASWKYVNNHAYIRGYLHKTDRKLPLVKMDLLVYCHPNNCKQLPPDCIEWSDLSIEMVVPLQPTCLARKETSFDASITTSFGQQYPYANAFIFVDDPLFLRISSHYDFVLKTDSDVFLGPAALAWVPNQPIHTGMGAYNSPFANARLLFIAKKLKLNHRGIHSIGSTWYGKPEIIIKLARFTSNLTRHFYFQEFSPHSPGLEGIFTEGADGKWPDWWRGVSSMYSAELAFNHLLPSFSDMEKAIDLIDVSTCETRPVLQFVHMHCWHNDCEFQKHRFMADVFKTIDSKTLDGRLAKYAGDEDFLREVIQMPVKDFCTYIAWNAAGNFIEHIIQLTRKSAHINSSDTGIILREILAKLDSHGNLLKQYQLQPIFQAVGQGPK